MPKDWLNISWKSLVIRGVIGLIAGVLILIWPINSVSVLAFIWGLWALFDAVASFIGAFDSGVSGGNRVLLVLMGIVSAIAGVIAVVNPGLTAVVLTWVLGIWLIVQAIFQLIGAFSSSVQIPKWLLVVGALLSGLLGVLFLANPGTGALAVTLTLGILGIIWGIIFIVTGFQVRKEGPVAPQV